MRRLRGWMPKSDTALCPCFWILCAAFGLGILLGQLAGRSLGAEQQDALASYLRRYAALCASAERPVQSALSAVLTYLRGRAALALAVGFLAAAFLLGLVGPGVFLLPALSALQGFFLSYSVACFAAALGRGGVKLALCAFGVRCEFILPCTFFLAAWGMRAAYARLRGPKKRRAPLTGADRTRLALCALLLTAGVFAELTAVPKLLQLGLAAIT